MIKYPKSKKVMASNTERNPLAEMAKEPILEFPDGSYLYVEWNNGKLTAGGVTNTGMIPEYEMDYNSDISVDQNLNNFYDYIIEQTPELMDEVESATHPITATTKIENIDVYGLETDDDPNYLVGVLVVNEEEFPFEYNIHEGSYEVHNYSKPGWYTGSSHEKPLPKIFNERNWDLIDETIQTAVDSYLSDIE